MSVLINLLPEARILKLKAEARKRSATTITVVTSVIIGTVAITLLLLLGYTYSTQRINKTKISNQKSDIAKSTDLEQKAATLQEHLSSFATLQSSRLYVSAIFSNLGNAIPSGVSVTSFQIGSDNTVTISGTSQTIAQVSTFAQALQDYNVNYLPQPGLDRKPLFSNVNITTVSKASSGGQVNFSMTFKVDPTLFAKIKGGGA